MSREMKDSGIPWIGEMPKDWQVNMLSSLFDEHKQKNKGLVETNLLSLSYGKIIRKDINTKEGLLPESFDGYNVISSGDIVFRLTDLQNDKRSLRTGLCLEKGIITSAYVTIRERVPLNSSYFHYLLHSYDLCKVFYGMGDGVRQGMNYSDLRKLLVLQPSLVEQRKIASFLDRKCAEIDEMIALQEKIVEGLKAYKQSVIIETVTKGLIPDVPMRDSGIEWIKKIPKHWKVDLLSVLFEEHKEKNTGLICKNLLSLSYGKIVRKSIDSAGGLLPQSYDGYNIVDNGDIVFRLTDLQNDKKSLRTGLVRERGIVTSAYVTLRSREPLLSAYYQYLFHTYDLLKVFYGMGDGVRQGMNYSDLRKMLILTPPEEEQRKIVNYLDCRSEEIESLISIKLSKIDSLKEYKKSIIYEYVTGKKEVTD